MLRVAKYLNQYFRPSASAVEVIDTSYVRDGQTLPAVVLRPSGLKRRAPAWIVLHGLTYQGLKHPSLTRFASAIAASGHVVFIPEISEWTQLHIAPALTTPTINAAALALAARADVDTERVGVIGFSFGATQGIVATTDDEVAQRVRALVSWGGYADLARAMDFGVTGDHELDGVREHIEPDPYGSWMFAGNYLTSVPGYEHARRVQDTLMELARAVGRSGTFAGDPVHEPLKLRLAEPLNREERALYEIFAPTTGTHDRDAARALARELAMTVIANDPLMDADPYFDKVGVPVLLAHGRDDRLVPYTETLRMQRRIPAARLTGCSITSLFSHSGGTEPNLGVMGTAREVARFVALLHRILGTL